MVGQSGSFGRTQRASLERHQSQVHPSLKAYSSKSHQKGHTSLRAFSLSTWPVLRSTEKR